MSGSNRRQSKRKVSSKLDKKLLDYKFLQGNEKILNLRNLNCRQLHQLMLSKGFLIEANAFLNELIDGMSFIIIFTEEEGIDMLTDDFNFSQQQILKLKEFYSFICKLRYLKAKNFKKDEFPSFN
eukprot:TRINITY_DN17624_c0_g1_i1.p1 TRINITY_DN17624_c0_g1~~TRINITY_DN17624_c0_g1_i1.p1  ORF type:complete len:125 (+),score=29.73 TRINITY_DN17624_c0_g1_i1:42-416(+)